MSTMTPIRPVNPMAAEGKDTVMTVLRRDQEKFFRLVEDSKNWNVQTRCTEWEVRDLVGHLIDVTEGYLARWEVARRGESVGALGLQVMGETLNDKAKEFRSLSRDDALARLRAGADRVMAIFEALTPEEWTGLLVTHPYMGPVPAGFYPAFQIMDYGIHPYDIEYGLGNKLATVYGPDQGRRRTAPGQPGQARAPGGWPRPVHARRHPGHVRPLRRRHRRQGGLHRRPGADPGAAAGGPPSRTGPGRPRRRRAASRAARRSSGTRRPTSC